MKIGILGSGDVAQQIALGFIRIGDTVKLGTRDTKKLSEWQATAGASASVGSFSDAAAFGEIVVLATRWDGTENAINLAGKENFKNKVVIDITNPLDFSKGMPPGIAVTPKKSGGSIVQEMLPDSKVVKAFNIVNAYTMTNPKMQEGVPDLLICGNDNSAKEFVTTIAKKWGWETITDMGDINESYWLEALVILWVRYGVKTNSWSHAMKLLKK